MRAERIVHDNPANPEPPADAPAAARWARAGSQGRRHLRDGRAFDAGLAFTKARSTARVLPRRCARDLRDVLGDAGLFGAGRLNLHLSAEGRVASMRCG